MANTYSREDILAALDLWDQQNAGNAPEPAPLPLTHVTTTGLNLRTAPSTTAGVITTLPTGTKVAKVGPESGAWWAVDALGQNGWVHSAYLTPIPPVPAPTPIDPTGEPVRSGLHGPADPDPNAWQDYVYNAYTTAKLTAAKGLAPGTGPEQVRRLQGIGVDLIVIRMFAKTGEGLTPQQYVDATLPSAKTLYDAGVRWFEAGANEANLFGEGLGKQWNNGTSYAAWHQQVIDLIRPAMPDALFALPALSPGGANPMYGVAEGPFMDQMLAALPRSYWQWVAGHAYWGADGTDWTVAARRIAAFGQRFIGTPVMITEYSNPAPWIDKSTKGNEYVALVGYDYPSNVAALFSYLSSAWVGWEAETWIENGQHTPIVAKMGARPGV